MSSLKRKLSRNKANKVKKAVERDLAAKVALFGEIGNKCLTCEAPFDKLDREHVTTWNVIVREQEKKVHLYCPSCWQKAINLIKEMEERINKRNLK